MTPLYCEQLGQEGAVLHQVAPAQGHHHRRQALCGGHSDLLLLTRDSYPSDLQRQAGQSALQNQAHYVTQ